MTDANRAQPIVAAERPWAVVRNAIRARPRTAVIGAALGVVTAGLAMNWSWLVATGIAPILVAIAPCAVMCALGLCMNRLTGQRCSAETVAQGAADPAPDQERPPATGAPAPAEPIARSRSFEEPRVPHA